MFSEPCTPRPFLEDTLSSISNSSIIQAKLNRRLGPEYVSQRPSPGGGPKLTYIEGWKIIGLANEVFGYNGWSSTVTKIDTDFMDIDPESRRCSVGVAAVVKITLKDGTYHEDIGYGTGDNLKSKGAALDKAKKEAVTDGVKRALRNFGNLLGLCLYEKSFTQEVIKIKPQHPKFDQSDLHRRERLDTTAPSTSGSHDNVSSLAVSSTEDIKPVPSLSPQIRSAPSKPSPLRNTVLAKKEPQDATHHGEQELAPQQRSFPESEAAPLPLSVQFDVNRAAPLQPSDSDIDSYFNDEDNDAFFAVKDPSMQGVESSDALDTIGGGARGVIRNANTNSEISRTGSPPSASVLRGGARVPGPSSDTPVSTLRQAIRTSAASLATVAGVKRSAEAIRSRDRMTDERETLLHRPPYLSHPRDTRTGLIPQQQQRLTMNTGRRAPLRELPIEESPDAKRVRR